ncbi:hypothetical protein LEP1GSC050_0870 [Leptospira broomii serovar Hurstbridge str. 5399]|uniref:Uncharacterized protein n=1 Tax=Leptospira broomii serovar Hurstbridge str. 5399 TaxID=1049789 RepID=T0GIM4_9LEPT|nr:hypothetical protein LEP1GSC050_0870 [Leptospira broomii serovar Hurstbridge str. 5399]
MPLRKIKSIKGLILIEFLTFRPLLFVQFLNKILDTCLLRNLLDSI